VLAAALTCALILDARSTSAIVCVVATAAGSVGGPGFAAAAEVRPISDVGPATQAEVVHAAGFRVILPVVTKVAASKSVPSSSSPPH